LNGIFIGDELTPQGFPFEQLEQLIDVVKASLSSINPDDAAKRFAIWYNDSDNMQYWPRIPRNLTIFSLDFYHPVGDDGVPVKIHVAFRPSPLPTPPQNHDASRKLPPICSFSAHGLADRPTFASV